MKIWSAIILPIQVVTIVLLAGQACTSSPQELPPAKYIEWVDDNDSGLRITTEADGFRYLLQYQPVSYLILKELGPGASEEEWAEMQKEFESLEYYLLKIEAPGAGQEVLKVGAGSVGEYNKRIYHCTGPMQNDISLIQGADTLPCKLYHFERMYQAAPYAKFLIAFDRADGDIDRIVRIHDRAFSGTILNFYFGADAIKNLPQLKLH